MDKSRVEPTIFFIEKISFSLKRFSGHFYGQSFIKTVRGPREKEIKCEACRAFYLFRNEFNKFNTVKSRLSERRLSETTGLFEDNGQSRLFSLLSIAIKVPIIRISIIRKIQFFEVIRRSRLKKLL